MKALLSGAFLALAATSALAADLPAGRVPVVLVPPPTFSWSGFYGGVNLGAEISTQTLTTSAVPTFGATTFPTESVTSAQLANGNSSFRRSSITGGGQIGYNFVAQTGILAGVETDIQGIRSEPGRAGPTLSGVPAAFPGETIVSTTTGQRNARYLGTVRGRVGYLITPRLLLFGTGGFAYRGGLGTVSIAQQNFSGNATDFANFGGPFAANLIQGGSRVGYAVGGGGEYMLTAKISLKADYLYYNFGSSSSQVFFSNNFLRTNVNGAAGTPAYTSLVRTSTRIQEQVVRAGINYHFNLF